MKRGFVLFMACAFLAGCSDVNFNTDAGNKVSSIPDDPTDTSDEGQPVFEVASGTAVQASSADGLTLNGTLGGTSYETSVVATSDTSTSLQTGFWSFFTSL